MSPVSQSGQVGSTPIRAAGRNRRATGFIPVVDTLVVKRTSRDPPKVEVWVRLPAGVLDEDGVVSGGVVSGRDSEPATPDS